MMANLKIKMFIESDEGTAILMLDNIADLRIQKRIVENPPEPDGSITLTEHASGVDISIVFDGVQNMAKLPIITVDKIGVVSSD